MNGLPTSARSEPLIERDLPCLGCGYNLRGLDIAGVCPECANPIAGSLQGEQLIHAHPRWIRGIARACTLLAAEFSLQLLYRYAGPLIWDRSPESVSLAEFLFAGVSGALLLPGVFLLTAPAPGRWRRSHTRTACRFLAVLVFCGLLFQMLLSVGFWWQYSVSSAVGWRVPSSWLPALAYAQLFLGWAGVPLDYLLFRWLARLLRRIPRPSLAWQAELVAVVLVVIGVVIITCFLCYWLELIRPTSESTMILNVIGAGRIWAIIVLVASASEFRRAVR